MRLSNTQDVSLIQRVLITLVLRLRMNRLGQSHVPNGFGFMGRVDPLSLLHSAMGLHPLWYAFLIDYFGTLPLARELGGAGTVKLGPARVNPVYVCMFMHITLGASDDATRV